MVARTVALLLLGIMTCMAGQNFTAPLGEGGLKDTDWRLFPTTKPPLNQDETSEDDNAGETKDDGVGNIESGDSHEMKKRTEALHLSAFGFGPAWFSQLDTDPQNYNLYVGYMYEPHPHAAVKTLVDITTDFNTSFVALANIGANFYVLTSAITPYVGGSFGMGYLYAEGKDDAGFTGSGSVGLMLFRTSDVHLNLEFIASVFLKQIQDKNPVLMVARIGLSL